MFELHQLRCFVAVAEELHFGRAATRMHMTQPPLSRQIQLLEHAIGTALFDRKNRTVRLTHAGLRLLPEALAILRMADNASLSTQRVGTGQAGLIRIGFTAAASYQFLPETLIRLRKRLPGIDLELREMVSRSQLDALENGQIDLGLLRPPISRDGMRSQRVVRESLVAALSSDHPLMQTPTLRLRDFRDYPVVTYSPDEARYFYDLIGRMFSAAGIAPRYSQYVSQVHSVLSLVRAGLGVALVPEAATRLHYDGISYRRISGLSPARPVELHVVWKKDNSNPALPHALEHLTASVT